MKAEPASVLQVAVGRLLLREGRCRDAAAWFEESFPEGHPSAQGLLWYLECLYRLGRFSELRRLARGQGTRWTDAEGLPHAAVEAVGLWAGERGSLGVAS